ncbi:MAG: IS3 family transposase [Bdellovibrionota bacterium]
MIDGQQTGSPDPEVTPKKAKRRSFSASYKKKILAEVENATGTGGIGEILRREGIYSSTLTSWRKERDAAMDSVFSKKRGPEPKRNPFSAENEKLRRQNQRLQEELRKAEIIIDVQKKGRAPVGSPAAAGSGQREVLMAAVEELSSVVGVKRACLDLSVPRSGLYRRRRRRLSPPPVGALRSSARRLNAREQAAVLACLHEERFQDCSPSQVYAALLDDGRYHCSIRTMYRLLEAEGENRERRDQLIHPPYRKPELLATGPNQLWSWDITKLRGPVKWSFYYLYVILDVFSRYVTGWMIAYRETAGLAKQLIENSCEKQGITPGQLTLHADRGSSMTSKSLALLLADLGVVKTHSRPHVSDDNPFSEAHFKTLKYRPEYPDRFGSIQDARRFCQEFFPWYNHQHHHSGLQLLTPATVHYRQAAQLISKRQAVLDAAYQTHPERFVRRPPLHPSLPDAVWINPPASNKENTP